MKNKREFISFDKGILGVMGLIAAGTVLITKIYGDVKYNDGVMDAYDDVSDMMQKEINTSSESEAE